MKIVGIIFSWIWGNIFDIALIVVGASALIIYVLQIKSECKTAAALIIEQIDSIEEIIEDLKNTYLHNNNTLDDNSVYLSREIVYAGAWSSYKHLMIKHLSNSEFDLLQKFFNSAYQIEKTRSDIIHCFKLGWNNKSLVCQLINGKFNDPTYELKLNADGKPISPIEMITAFNIANQNTISFNPQIAYSGLYAELNNYNALSGTTAYAKLLKLSGRK